MPLYKSATNQTVSYKRFAINHLTGVELPEAHPELDKLVEEGLLTVDPKPEPATPVVSPTKPTSPKK